MLSQVRILPGPPASLGDFPDPISLPENPAIPGPLPDFLLAETVSVRPWCRLCRGSPRLAIFRFGFAVLPALQGIYRERGAFSLCLRQNSPVSERKNSGLQANSLRQITANLIRGIRELTDSNQGKKFQEQRNLLGRDQGPLRFPKRAMLCLDEAVRCEGGRLPALDDCGDDVRCQKGEIHQMGDPALGDALTFGNGLHGGAGLDFLEPEPTPGDGLQKGAVDAIGLVAHHQLGLDTAAAEGEASLDLQSLTLHLPEGNAEALGDGLW